MLLILSIIAIWHNVHSQSMPSECYELATGANRTAVRNLVANIALASNMAECEYRCNTTKSCLAFTFSSASMCALFGGDSGHRPHSCSGFSTAPKLWILICDHPLSTTTSAPTPGEQITSTISSHSTTHTVSALGTSITTVGTTTTGATSSSSTTATSTLSSTSTSAREQCQYNGPPQSLIDSRALPDFDSCKGMATEISKKNIVLIRGYPCKSSQMCGSCGLFQNATALYFCNIELKNLCDGPSLLIDFPEVPSVNQCYGLPDGACWCNTEECTPFPASATPAYVDTCFFVDHYFFCTLSPTLSRCTIALPREDNIDGSGASDYHQ